MAPLNSNGIAAEITQSKRMGCGRGIAISTLKPSTCLCQRPRCHVLCNVCGFLMWSARIRYSCPIHPQTVFLTDITQCPNCRAYEFMMTEF